MNEIKSRISDVNVGDKNIFKHDEIPVRKLKNRFANDEEKFIGCFIQDKKKTICWKKSEWSAILKHGGLLKKGKKKLGWQECLVEWIDGNSDGCEWEINQN